MCIAAMSHLAPRFGGVVLVEARRSSASSSRPASRRLADIHVRKMGSSCQRVGPNPRAGGRWPRAARLSHLNDSFFYTTQRTIAQAWAAGPTDAPTPPLVDTAGFAPPNG